VGDPGPRVSFRRKPGNGSSGRRPVLACRLVIWPPDEWGRLNVPSANSPTIQLADLLEAVMASTAVEQATWSGVRHQISRDAPAR